MPTSFRLLSLDTEVVEPFIFYQRDISFLANGNPNQPQPMMLICFSDIVKIYGIQACAGALLAQAQYFI